MRAGLVCLIVLICQMASRAQLDNHVFEDRLTLQATDSNRLFLGLNLLGFVRNNEYFDTIIEGYTLLGYQLNPYLSYHLSGKIRLDAGVYLQHDFGTNGFAEVVPTLSLKLKHKNFNLIFGNLEGSLSHRLIEPVYDFERMMNNRLETGIQGQVMKDDLFLDFWLDWQNMIYNRDPGQEEFIAGISLSKRLYNGAWKLLLPLQAIASHKGGQINLNPPPLETIYNTAIGLELRRQMNGLFTSAVLNGFYVYSDNVSSVLQRPYRDGEGYYFNAGAKLKWGVDVMVSYWSGNEFQSAQGGKIYPSVSFFDHTVQREKMELLIFRFLYQLNIADGFYGAFRVEPYYDFGFDSFQYSTGLYLQFNDRFFLAEKRK